MTAWAKEGYPIQCKWKAVAASQTTAQISASGDGVPGRDYLERVIVTAASTAAPGAVTIFDGTQALLVHNVQITGYTGTNVYTYEVGVHAQTTKGFNVTTGTSISALCIGIF